LFCFVFAAIVFYNNSIDANDAGWHKKEHFWKQQKSFTKKPIKHHSKQFLFKFQSFGVINTCFQDQIKDEN
jgi:hypothetical protein